MGENNIEIQHSYDLISFEVHLQEIQLRFGAVTIAFSDAVEIIHPDGRSDRIDDVWERKGNLQAIWDLIGSRMRKITMDEESFRLIFSDGTTLKRKYERANELIKVWGPEPNYFTSYPDCLGPGPSGQTKTLFEAIREPGRPKRLYPKLKP
jgi:hypothetical protein